MAVQDLLVNGPQSTKTASISTARAANNKRGRLSDMYECQVSTQHRLWLSRLVLARSPVPALLREVYTADLDTPREEFQQFPPGSIVLDGNPGV